MNKEELRDLLRESIAEITFTKMDGTIRVLHGTLMPEHLPPLPTDASLLIQSKRDENPKILAVWDMDKEDWRSFRLDTVLMVNVVYPLNMTGVKYAAPTQESP